MLCDVTLTLFFLNQQFITWSIKVDHSRHNISTYRETEPTCKQKRREKEKKKERYKRLRVTNNYVELLLNIKALLLNIRKEMK